MVKDHKRWLLSALALLLSGLCFPVYASVPATGTFKATLACEAYQSIRRKTNPGDIRLEIGRTYEIFELNVPDGTTWYRVRVDEASPAERWAYFECGTAEIMSQEHTPSPGGTAVNVACSTAGLEDSYVLAVSWQPAFCETHSDKPECSVTDPQSYQARNFTLHGLWPNKQDCGRDYGFCGRYQSTQRPFCNYDPVPMQPTNLGTLGQFMPSAAHGSCLQRHEWYKHGTCQTQRDADGYFDTAVQLLEEFNTSGIAAFMQANIGHTVNTESFFDAVDTAFQDDAHRRLQISCAGGKLVDVYINLPAELPDSASLTALMAQADPKFHNGCGSSFEIDTIGQ